MALQAAVALRAEGLTVGLDHNSRSLKKQLAMANRLRSHFVIVLGGNELAPGAGIRIKDLDTGEEKDSLLVMESLAEQLNVMLAAKREQ